MNDDMREYVYQPKWTMIVLCALFFGLCTIILGSVAANNDHGIIINRIIELGPDGTTVFYWILTVLSAGFVVLAVFLAYHRLTFQQRLVFGHEKMTVPASRWSRQQKTITYKYITALSQAAVSGQKFLYIIHPGGKYTIAAAMLPSKAIFSEICELLASRVQAVSVPDE